MGSYLFKNCVCVLMLLSAFLVRGNQFELKFREISPPGGFTFGAINHVIEDRHGFIWFSSRHGLFRYNTETIEKFIHIPANPNSIPSNIINSMSKDIDGTLWFATEGGVCFYNEKIEVFETVLFVNEGIDTLKSAVQQIICDKDGRIWILSNSILYRSRYGSNITERITITSAKSFHHHLYK